MDQQQFKRIPFFGIFLVVLGVGLLLHQLNIVSIDGESMVLFGLVAYGAITIIRSFLTNVRSSLFFASLCFFSGVLLFLGKYDLVEHSPFVYIPGFLMVFGMSFLMLYLYNMREYHLLVPAAIFLALGVAFMMTEVGYWYPSDVKEAVRTYWPAALILFGILLLFRKKPTNR